MTDMIDPEHASRWELRRPDGVRIPDVSAFDVTKGYYEQTAEARDDAPPGAKRRTRPARTWRQVYADFDVYDLLNDLVAHRVRRFP